MSSFLQSLLLLLAQVLMTSVLFEGQTKRVQTFDGRIVRVMLVANTQIDQ